MAAIRFYCDALGLKVGRRFGGDAVEMLGNCAPIYLLLKSESSPESSNTSDRRRYNRHWTPVHLDCLVYDIQSSVARAVAAGARLEAPIVTHPWGRLALMVNPFGHGFCFIQFLGEG